MFGYVQCYEIIPCDYLLIFTVETFCPPVRLVGGKSDNEGRVEIYYNNTWGTVCWNSWNYRDSNTVCRQLGYTEYITYYRSPLSDEENAPVWMDGVDCDSYEVCLGKCSFTGFGNNKCGHSLDAFVKCKGTWHSNIQGNIYVDFIVIKRFT